MNTKFSTQTMITSAQAAERFGVTKEYVAQLCRTQKVDAVRVGRSWHIHEDGLKDFLQRKQRKATKQTNKSVAVKSFTDSDLVAFTRAPSYFWVTPDIRVVFKGVVLGSFFLCMALSSGMIWNAAAEEHQPAVTLQSEYVAGESESDVLTASVDRATSLLDTPQFSNTFSPIVPFGPLLGASGFSISVAGVVAVVDSLNITLGEMLDQNISNLASAVQGLHSFIQDK